MFKRFLFTRAIFFVIALYAFFVVFSIVLFNDVKENELHHYHETALSAFSKNYTTVYRKLSNEIFLKFFKIFQKPEILKIMSMANQTKDAESLQLLRERLTELVEDDAAELRKNGIRQFQFHLPNAISFLRMHKKQHFGDDLSSVRPSIVRVNETRSLVTGYEMGRHIGAFRNVIPLYYQEKFVGTLEISFDESKFIEELERIMGSEMDFIIEKKLLDRVLYKPEQSKYHISEISTNYYSLNKLHSDIKGSTSFSGTEIENYILKSDIEGDLKKYEPFHISIPIGDHIDALFVPVKDFKDDAVGYLLAYTTDTEESRNTHRYYDLGLSLSLGILTLFMAFVVSLIIYSKRIQLKQKYFDTVFNTQEDIIVITEGKSISTANMAFYDFLEYDDMAAFKKDYSCICDTFEIIDKEDYIYKDKDGENWVVTLETNPHINYKAVIIKDEKPYTFKVRSTNMLFDDEKRSVVVLNNITQLIDIQENLEQKVKEGVDTIHKQELVLFQQAKQASLGEMIAMIAHQWRQPLASIAATIGSLQMKQAMQKYDKEFYDEQLEKTSGLVQHLSQTIEDFRGFYKESKQTEKVNIDDVVTSSLEIMKPVLINKGISVDTRFATTDDITTHPNELKQVLINIFKNAEDALLERDIKDAMIKITTEQDEKGVSVIIQDNAGGIPEDVKDKIFDPYFTTKGDLHGTGLGLYMSHDIVKNHLKGDISVENIEGGACFTIIVPFDVDAHSS